MIFYGNVEQANFTESNHYCREEKMQLLYLENEEEHEYLYNFMSINYHSTLVRLWKTYWIRFIYYLQVQWENSLKKMTSQVKKITLIMSMIT